MSNITVANEKNMQAVESALVRNDISKLSTQERITYINRLCESVGLNPLTKPFAIITLQGKETIYAQKDCAEQLRKIHGVSTQIISKGIVGDYYEVHVKARDKTGKEDEDFASIPLNGAKGNDFSNLTMKCVTKAKRRVTLSICGLGILDESELETISDIKPAHNPRTENIFQKDEPKDVTPKEPTPEIPEVLNDNGLGDFVCRVGKKYAGQKLSEINLFELDGFIKNTQKWFKDEGKTPNSAWVEFFQTAEAYLQSKEVQQEPEGA